ncbi:LysR family transcriptional regulator [Aquincola sp. MAHUQ-54]|uniref:LysR family transcriptional regulator n=1 Tax=Aquincola agrisoli TaxID=3119538 RepID=A0AAW9QDK9_9BURK
MRHLNPDHLLTLTAVIQKASFSKAAEHLEMSQPAVSHHIKELERRLQLRLVERVGRRVRATEAGGELALHAQRISLALADAEAALTRWTDSAAGKVRIGAGATACIHLLPPMLGRLKRANPQLEIAVSTGNTPEVVRRVEENTLDAALVTLPISSRSLDVTPVLEDPFVAIAPRGAAQGRRSVTAVSLSRHPLVLFEEGANTRALINQWFRDGGLAVRPVMELGSVEAIKEMVAAHLGWSLLPQLGVAQARSRRGIEVLPLSPRLSRTLAWVIRRDKPLSRPLQQVQKAVLALGAAARAAT